MNNNESLLVYNQIGEELGNLYNVEMGQMFGKKCLKYKGKAFAAYYEGDMVFKLQGDLHKEVLNLGGSQLWDPSKKHRPMKDWVQVSSELSLRWRELAEQAKEKDDYKE